MFILFDAQCKKCRRSFKAEGDSGADAVAERGQYRCVCPKCYAPVLLRVENGTAAAAGTGWAVPATAVGGTSSAAPDAAT